VRLETERLVLRDFAPEDFEALYATTTGPEYRRYYSEAETTRDHWRDIFAHMCAAREQPDRRTYQLAVCLASGELIGTCGVRVEDAAQRQGSFGCAIDRRHWGRGLAREASRLVLDHGFGTLALHRIHAETISENARSRKLAERLGMRLEGELRHARYFRDRWWDVAIYAVLAPEWTTER